MKDFILRLSVPGKCALVAAAICAVTGVVLILASLRAGSLLLTQTTDSFGHDWAKQLAAQAQRPLMNNDRISLQTLLRSHADNPLIARTAAYDGEQQLIVEAGETGTDGRRFSAAITIARDQAGHIEVTVNDTMLRNEMRVLGWKLLLLTSVLIGLASALVMVPARRLETWLHDARQQLRQPLAEIPAPPYPGQDALAQLFSDIHRGTDISLPAEEQDAEWVILHIRWRAHGRLVQQWGQADLDKRLATSYRRCAALARLYHGTLVIHRSDGPSFRFKTEPGIDDPLFRAVCCAWLLQKLDGELRAQGRIGLLRRRGNRWQIEAAESALIDSLHQADSADENCLLQLPVESRQQLAEWAELKDNYVEAIQPPYQHLLEKQLEKLQQWS